MLHNEQVEGVSDIQSAD